MELLSPRQVHLDFHTSEHIPDIGMDFNPEEFAETAEKASVSSMTVFARCHHGLLYYDSAKYPELVHPNLINKNLLIDQIKALHKKNIRAPIYITVQWDHHSAVNHPEWLIRKASGTHEGGPFTDAGFYQSLCVNTEYFNFLEAQTREICGLLGDELDGVFFDIVGIRPCLCASCRREMREKNIDMRDESEVRKFAAFVMNRFKSAMTEIVREYSDDCTIFYNAGHIGPCTKESADTFTHYELESLPSGGWGYLHFPATVRYARKLGHDCMGMTGKFHTSWGDFHSLKNQAALEFECFRMLSFGCACSIGDQLEPNGRLNTATYDLIGSIYGRYERLEQYGRPSIPLVEAAVLTNESPLHEHQLSDELLGACQLLEELSLQFDIIDTEMDMLRYKLIILTDNITADEKFADKLDEYVSNGGKLITAMNGGKNSDNEYPKSFGIKYIGKNDVYPDFLISEGELSSGLVPNAEYVIYRQGNTFESQGAEAIMSARSPYFKRDGEKFCSHRYTPSAKGEPYPSVFKNGNVIIFSHPIFAQYRENAPHWCKQLIKNALDILLPQRIVTHNGASTICVTALSQPENSRVTLHLLSYIPVRKSASIDIVEDVTVANDVEVTVNLPYEIKSARSATQDCVIQYNDGKINIPKINGYEIIVLEY